MRTGSASGLFSKKQYAANAAQRFMRKLDKGKNAKELAQTVVKMLMPYKEYIKLLLSGKPFPHIKVKG